MAKKFMTDERIMSMISDLVQKVDYDIWKQMFEEDCMEDPEMAEQNRATLLKIVKKYL